MSKRQEDVSGTATIRLPQFWCVKVGKSNLYPFVRIGGHANTEAIAVSDVANGSAKHLP